MGILSTGAANAAKRAIEQALPDRCAVLRVTRTTDPTTGGWTDDETSVASGIPCRVDKSGLAARERAVPLGGMLTAIGQFDLMLSAHPSRWPGGVIDIRSGDVLLVTGEGQGRYEPVGPGGPVTDELARAVSCNRQD